MDSCSSDDESSDEEAHGQHNARHDEWPIYDRDLALAGMPWSNSVAFFDQNNCSHNFYGWITIIMTAIIVR